MKKTIAHLCVFFAVKWEVFYWSVIIPLFLSSSLLSLLICVRTFNVMPGLCLWSVLFLFSDKPLLFPLVVGRFDFGWEKDSSSHFMIIFFAIYRYLTTPEMNFPFNFILWLVWWLVLDSKIPPPSSQHL
jgi:hypothetical protein